MCTDKAFMFLIFAAIATDSVHGSEGGPKMQEGEIVETRTDSGG